MYAERQKDFFLGALVGGAVATLVSLLFTTKKGKQIQDQIVDLYENVEEKVKDTFADTKNKVAESAENMGKKIAQKTKSDDFNK